VLVVMVRQVLLLATVVLVVLVVPLSCRTSQVQPRLACHSPQVLVVMVQLVAALALVMAVLVALVVS
jgi:hypothetical protein